MLIFLRLILGVMLGLDVYWWWRSDHQLRLLGPTYRARIWRTLLALFMAVMLATLLTRMLRPAASRTVNSAIPMPIVSAQYIWHLLLLPVACILPLLYRGGKSLARLIARKPAPPPAPMESLPLTTRRGLMKAVAVALPPLVTAGGVTASLTQLGKFRIRKMDLRIPSLPPELDGMTIAHLSDFHVGRFMTPAMMRPVIDVTNDMKPDLVLVTGDLIDYALVDLPPAIEELRRLRPPRSLEDSVALCVGNHDIIEDEKTFITGVQDAGIPLLVNGYRTVTVRGCPIQLLGIDWAKTSRTASSDQNTAALVRAAATVRDPAAFPILLAHHPHAYDEAARQNLPLTLSGHTHGGQLMATQHFGAGSIMFRYWSGLYSQPRAWNGPCESQLIVSNGIGNWFPLRVNAPAEIIHLTLRRT